MSLLFRALKFRGFKRLIANTALRKYSNSGLKLFEEVQIAVPWGHIAGKHWNGGEGKTPVICLHGWKDNASSFDLILPLLIPALHEKYKGCKFQFLAIDLPGHGHSSHYPPGVPYRLVPDSFLWLLNVMSHFGWTQVNIIGHSLGAIMGFLFAGTHPGSVNALIALDGLTPVIFSKADMLRMAPEMTEHWLHMERKIQEKKAPSYTAEQALKLLLQSHMMGLHPIACETLMKRGMKKDPYGKFQFSHDIRVQYLPITTFSHRQIAYIAKNFRSSVLHIKAADGVNYMSTYMNANIRHWIEEDNPEKVEFINIPEATHHFHLTSPWLVFPHIASFLPTL